MTVNCKLMILTCNIYVINIILSIGYAKWLLSIDKIIFSTDAKIFGCLQTLCWLSAYRIFVLYKRKISVSKQQKFLILKK